MKNTNTMFRHVSVERDVSFTTSDGIRLFSDIYRPETPAPLPAIIMRLPYDKDCAQTNTYAHPIWYARHGYVVVVQDTRGRYKSEGEFYPFSHEAVDGYETVQWVSKLPYCDGSVGMYGFSFPGMSQLMTAALQPPALKTAVPAFTGCDLYDNWHYVGGAFSLAFNATWSTFLAAQTALKKGHRELHLQMEQAGAEYLDRCWRLPLSDINAPYNFVSVAPYFNDWLEHPVRDNYWKKDSIQEQYQKIETPLLHLGGWYDTFIEGTIHNYTNLKQRGADEKGRAMQRLLIGPWLHMPWAKQVGDGDFGDEAANLLDEYQIDWYNYWLKGIESPFLDLPPVRIFVMGENRWRAEQDWPPASARMTPYFLHSQGRANSNSGNGRLSPQQPEDELPDVYVYDPHVPVTSIGGRSCCLHIVSPMGAYDQTPNEIRNDVLVYTTDALEADTEVTGAVKAVIWASTTAQDTDFTVKLVDVHPDGSALNICDGIIRARFRESLEHPTPVKPHEIYRYEIMVGSTSNLFKQGHRMRVEVSSSNFPLYDRNPNTGGWSKDAGPTDFKVATQMVFHDNQYPSQIILPVIRR